MAEYWIKTDAEAEPQGPYRSSDLKTFAAAGQIAREWLVSVDQQKWIPAGRVNGLTFPEVVAPAAEETAPYDQSATGEETAEHAPDPAPIDPFEEGATYEPAEATSEALPLPVRQLAYQSAVSSGAWGGYGPVGKRRDLRWMVVGAAIGALGQLGNFVAPVIASHPQRGGRVAAPPPDALAVVLILVALVALVFLTITGIYTLVWFYKVHREMRDFTGGTYPTSPGKALGFCFIPLFNLYWIVVMPGRLAAAVAANLRGDPRAISPGTVYTLQIISIVPGSCLPGAQMVLQTVSILKIQGSLNLLWEQASFGGNRPA